MDKIKNYLKPENIIAQARLKRCVMICAENENDEAFWQMIFEKYAPELKISFIYPHETDRGKRLILDLYAQDLQAEFCLCVDSDYDYLTQNPLICQNPFIFQTYTNGRENYLCFAERLKNLAIKASLWEAIDFDFQRFMLEYSKIIYELFLYSVYFEKQNQSGFTQSQFNHNIKLNGKIKARYGFQAELESLKQTVQNKIQQLQTNYTQIKLDSLKSDLETLGLNPENTYLFVDDHTIETITLNILHSVIQNARADKIKEFYQFYKNEIEILTQKETEYRNQLIDIQLLMQESTGFENCFLLQKIQTDIQNFVANRKK